jgi:hypothetical protein
MPPMTARPVDPNDEGRGARAPRVADVVIGGAPPGVHVHLDVSDAIEEVERRLGGRMTGRRNREGWFEVEDATGRVVGGVRVSVGGLVVAP